MLETNSNFLPSDSVAFLSGTNQEGDSGIVLSSRVRLARNLAVLPFAAKASDDDRKMIMEQVSAAFGETPAQSLWRKFDLGNLSEVERMILLERHLISNNFLHNAAMEHVLFLNEREDNAVMVNEEDHLRIQVLKANLNLNECYRQADEIDTELSQKLDFAFDPQIGFLSSCPTNLGTGLRASAMLHLIGLELSGQLKAAINGINTLGYAVRGFFGEGSSALGDLYQISNQSTLGESEEEIIEKLKIIINKFVEHEKQARYMLLKKRQNFVLDQVGRAYGILRHSYSIDYKEAVNALSRLRLGTLCGMFSELNLNLLNEIFIGIHPGHLRLKYPTAVTTAAQDAVRSLYIREKLRPMHRSDNLNK